MKSTNYYLEIAKTIIGVVLFVLVIRLFVIQPFYVIGSSMEPDYHNGDYLFVNELTSLFKGPSRGDVIVFRHPEEECTAYVNKNRMIKNLIEGPCKSYIKRVIGLPGDTVQVKDGKVSVNDKILNEAYIENIQTLGNQKVTLKENEYYVLGDNREPNASSDSREWGPLEKKYIVGKVFTRIYPSFWAIKRPSYNI